MGVEDIGARLVLDPGTFIATTNEATAATDRLVASLTKLGITGEASMAKLSKAGDAAAIAGTGSAVAHDETAIAAAGAGAATVAGAKKAGAALDSTAAKARNLKGELATLASGPVGKLGFGGLVASVGVIGESVDQYMKYQKSMTQLVSQAGLQANRLPTIMQGGLNIGKQTGLNFNDIANQLYRIVSATTGLKETNKQILALGKSAADVAVLFNTGTGAPTEQVARMFGSIVNAGVGNKKGARLQQTGGSAKGIAALLNATVGTGDIRGQDLVGALGRGVLQSGQAVSAKLPDILSWLDLSTHLGAQPSTSGTLIAHAIQQLAGGSEQAKKAEAMVGVSPSEMAGLIKNKGIGAAVADLYTKAQSWNPESYFPVFGKNAPGAPSAMAQANAWMLGTPQEMSSFYNNTASPQVRQQIETQLFAKMFGGARQEIPFLTIAENQPKYAAIEAQIRQQATAGTYNKDLAAAMSTPAQQLKIAERQLQSYSIELGKDLTPGLVHFAHGVVDVAHFLADHKAVLYGIGGIFAALTGAGVAVYSANKIIKVIDGIKGFLSFLGGVSSKVFGTSTGPSTIAPQAANTTALDANTVAIEELSARMYSNVFTGASGSRTLLTGAGTAGEGEVLAEEAGAAGGGGLLARLGISKLGAMGTMGKLATGASLTAVASMLYNAVAEKPLSHLVGQKTAAGFGDVLTGAGIGATIGSVVPGVGTLLGGGAGALIGLAHAIAGPGVKGPSGLGGAGTNNTLLNSLQRSYAYYKSHPNAVNNNLAQGFAQQIKSMGATPGPSTTVQTGTARSQGSRRVGQANLIHDDMLALAGIKTEYGANSAQYKAQYGYTLADARKAYGGLGGKGSLLGKPSSLASPYDIKALSEAIAAAQTKQSNKNMLASTMAGYHHQRAMDKLYTDSTPQGGGNLLHTLQAVNQSKSTIKDLKIHGGSLEHIQGVEKQLQQEQAHLKELNADQKKLGKTTDIEKQTTALTAALKNKDNATNDLLGQILGALRSLKVTVNIPATPGQVPGGTGSKPART